MPVPKFFQGRGETFERNNDITRDGEQFLGVVAAGSPAASGAAAAPQIQVVLSSAAAGSPTRSRASKLTTS